MRYYLWIFLLITLGCSNAEHKTLIKTNNIKAENLEKDIERGLEQMDYLIEFYNNPFPYVDLRQRLKGALAYIDSTSSNPNSFNYDIVMRKMKRTSNKLEEQVELIKQLAEAGNGALVESSLELEFNRLKQRLVEEALLEFELLTFRLDEPMMMIETDKDIYSMGDSLTGKVRMVFGSNNMGRSIEYIKVNEDTIKVSKEGIGQIQSRITSRNDNLSVEMKMRDPIEGKFVFKKNKSIIIK